MKSILPVIFLMFFTLSSAFSAEFIDSKAVSGNAEVVLEFVKDEGQIEYYQYSYRTKLGINWVFYQKPVRVRGADGNLLWEHKWIANEVDELKTNDKRISFFLFDDADCVIVTLDVDPSSPKMHEDRFHDVIGNGDPKGARLIGVDELNITDSGTSKALKRDKDGIWRFEGIPYTNKLESKERAVPLPPLPQVVDLKADSTGASKAPTQGSQNVPPKKDARRQSEANEQMVPRPRQEDSNLGLAIGLGIAGVLLVAVVLFYRSAKKQEK